MIIKTCAQVFDKVARATEAWKVDKCVILILEALMNDKRVSVRSCSAQVISLFLEKWDKSVALLASSLVDRLEKAIAKCVADQDASVRKSGRDALFMLSNNWSDSSTRYFSPLSIVCY